MASELKTVDQRREALEAERRALTEKMDALTLQQTELMRNARAESNEAAARRLEIVLESLGSQVDSMADQLDLVLGRLKQLDAAPRSQVAEDASRVLVDDLRAILDTQLNDAAMDKQFADGEGKDTEDPIEAERERLAAAEKTDSWTAKIERRWAGYALLFLSLVGFVLLFNVAIESREAIAQLLLIGDRDTAMVWPEAVTRIVYAVGRVLAITAGVFVCMSSMRIAERMFTPRAEWQIDLEQPWFTPQMRQFKQIAEILSKIKPGNS